MTAVTPTSALRPDSSHPPRSFARKASPAYLHDQLPDLAPQILRQRLVIEGRCPQPITREQIVGYLTQLTDVCGMSPLMVPTTHASPLYGWAGWVHWETSGAHFYAWDRPLLFFSVDIYTCKRFDPEAAAAFTQRFFDAAPLVAQEF